MGLSARLGESPRTPGRECRALSRSRTPPSHAVAAETPPGRAGERGAGFSSRPQTSQVVRRCTNRTGLTLRPSPFASLGDPWAELFAGKAKYAWETPGCPCQDIPPPGGAPISARKGFLSLPCSRKEPDGSIFSCLFAS